MCDSKDTNIQIFSESEQFSNILKRVLLYTQDYFEIIRDKDILPQSLELEQQLLIDQGNGTLNTLEYFFENIADQLSASNGPRYLGFVTGGATPAGIIGDWITSLYDQNVSHFSNSIAGKLENDTIDMLRQLFNLSSDFTGSFVSGATMSNFVGLAQAREWIGEYHNINISEKGLSSLEPIKILSAVPHSSILKSLSMLGLGRDSLQYIPCQKNSETIDVSKLEEALKEINQPCIVVANAGTVNTVAFDDLISINKLKEKYNFWLHVDGAFGGFAACSPKYKHLVEGINEADSLTIDAHKWLNVPYDSAMQFTRHKKLQYSVFKNNASYLENSNDEIDYCHLTPENSRRFRALPVWFTLKAYGRLGYQKLIEQNSLMARMLGNKISDSHDFILLSDVQLNGICFTLSDSSQTEQFLEALNHNKKVFLTPTIYRGTSAIRISFSNWQTIKQDVEIIWESMLNTLSQLNNRSDN